jgi:hypothetical protein
MNVSRYTSGGREMNPKCLLCHKPLKQQTISRNALSVFQKHDEFWNDKEEIQKDADAHAGKPVKVVSYRKRWKETDTREICLVGDTIETLREVPIQDYEFLGYDGYSYGIGYYGCYGTGQFCTASCGFDWAVRNAPRDGVTRLKACIALRVRYERQPLH